MHFEVYGSASQVANAVKKLGKPTSPVPIPIPGEPKPIPKPQPPEDEDMMYNTYQPSGGPDSGGIWIAGPGFCQVIPSMEYYNILVGTGAAKPVRSVSQREFDVLKDSYRSFPNLVEAAEIWNHALTSKVTNAPCSAGDMLAYTNLHTEPKQG
jgi:hypothetical protein